MQTSGIIEAERGVVQSSAKVFWVGPSHIFDFVSEPSKKGADFGAERQPIQDAIGAVLFKCYGLSDDEANHITGRLKEML